MISESEPELRWGSGAAVAVVLAAAGYPGTPRTGGVIRGFDIARQNGSVVVQAGTAVDASGRVISAGGRVLAVVGTGDDLAAARSRAYASIAKLELDGAFYRSDIAEQAARMSARQAQGA